MSECRYTVLFEPAEEGGYVATCPALPGLVTEGDTLDKARDMVRDAILGYLESLRKDGVPAPDDIKLFDEPVKEEIEDSPLNGSTPSCSQTQSSRPSPRASRLFSHHTTGGYCIQVTRI